MLISPVPILSPLKALNFRFYLLSDWFLGQLVAVEKGILKIVGMKSKDLLIWDDTTVIHGLPYFWSNFWTVALYQGLLRLAVLNHIKADAFCLRSNFGKRILLTSKNQLVMLQTPTAKNEFWTNIGSYPTCRGRSEHIDKRATQVHSQGGKRNHLLRTNFLEYSSCLSELV